MDLSSGEVPDEPGVHGAEEEPALAAGCADRLAVVEEPAQLQSGEVGGDWEAAEMLQAVLAPRISWQSVQYGLIIIVIIKALILTIMGIDVSSVCTTVVDWF